MPTPSDAQTQINNTIKPNGVGAITAVSLAAVLTTIVGVFSLYAPLSGANFTGGVNIVGTKANDSSTAALVTNGYSEVTKTSTAANAGATGFIANGFDGVGGDTTFVEGLRGSGLAYTGINAEVTGVVGLGHKGGASNDGPHGIVLGMEGETIRDGTGAADAPTFGTFDRDHFAASFLATARFGVKPDAGFLTNPYNAVPFRTGFLVGENSVDDTAFANRAIVVTGLDLTQGGYSYALARLANNKPIMFRNAANNADLNMIYTDTSNNFVLGTGAATVTLVAPTYTTTANAQRVHYNVAALPGSPIEGDCAWDNSVHKLKCYDGSAWQAAW